MPTKKDLILKALYQYSDANKALEISIAFSKLSESNIQTDLRHMTPNYFIWHQLRSGEQQEYVDSYTNKLDILKLHHQGRTDLIEHLLSFSTAQSKLYNLVDYDLAYPLAASLRQTGVAITEQPAGTFPVQVQPNNIYGSEVLEYLNSCEIAHCAPLNIWLLRAYSPSAEQVVWTTRSANLHNLSGDLILVDQLRKTFGLTYLHCKLVQFGGIEYFVMRHLELVRRITFKVDFIIVENSAKYNLQFMHQKFGASHRLTRLLLFCIALNTIPNAIYQVSRDQNYFAYIRSIPSQLGSLSYLNQRLLTDLYDHDRHHVIKVLTTAIERTRVESFAKQLQLMLSLNKPPPIPGGRMEIISH